MPYRLFTAGFQPQIDFLAKSSVRRNGVFQQNRPQPAGHQRLLCGTVEQPDDPLRRKLRGYHFLAVLKMEMQATAAAGIAGCIRKRVEEEIVVVH